MTTQDFRLNLDDKLTLTERELDLLRTHAASGDRVGFYMAYYNMTGNETAILQARISSFSGSIGGIAYVANFVLQEAFRDAPEDEGRYKGIYKISQEIVDEELARIELSVANEVNGTQSSGGFLTDLEFFNSARAVWERNGQADQFPGDELNAFANWADQAFGLANFDLASIDVVALLTNVVDILTNLNSDNFDDILNALTNDPSVFSGLVGVFGADVFGKRLSDYAGREGYRFINTPDGRFVNVIDESTNKTVGIFDDSFIPRSLADIAELLIGSIPNLLIPGFDAIEERLTLFFTDFRANLFEGGNYSGGDFNPNEPNDPFPLLEIASSNEATEDVDVLLGEDGFFNNRDNLDAGAGDDFIFGGDADDELRGGTGDDVIYGGEDEDRLFGGAGDDVLRGGLHNDRLEGGTGNDILDGGDVTPNASGQDILIGGADNDVLIGGDGDDQLYGDTETANAFIAGDDQLFGGDGNDTLTGGAGNDYLEGGAGNDIYRFDYGDDRDRIVDNGAATDVNVLELTHTDAAGAVPTPVVALELIAGTNTYQELDANGNVINSSTVYQIVSGANAGQQDLHITINGGDGGTITIENWGDVANRFGIAVTRQTIAPPEQPVTVNNTLAENTIDGLNATDTEVLPWQPDRLNAEIATSETITGTNFIDYIAGGDGDDFIDSGRSAVPVGFSDEGFFDTIAGGMGSDYLVGGDGDHLIFGGNGGSPHITFGGIGSVDINADGEFFYARASEGATDNDYIEGGAGDDLLSGEEGDDHIDGGADNDELYGGAGSDRLIAGAGDDFVYGDGVLDIFNIEQVYPSTTISGSDVPVGALISERDGIHEYDDFIDGGLGNDRLIGGLGNDTVNGGDGDDRILGDHWRQESDFKPTLIHQGVDSNGNAVSRNIIGAQDLAAADYGDDTLLGGAGLDTIYGQGGNDFIDGGTGDDELHGDDFDLSGEFHGADTLFGGEGSDQLVGHGGADTLYGGVGDDLIFGDDDGNPPVGEPAALEGQYHADDFIDGGAGDDQIEGSGGSDEIYGGTGDDFIFGDADDIAEEFHGDDFIDGGEGNDDIRGGAGDDILLGGAGNDQLIGDAGNDTLTGGSGVDVLAGGAGDDRYVFNRGDASELTAANEANTIVDSEGSNTLVINDVGINGINVEIGTGFVRFNYFDETIFIGDNDFDAIKTIEVNGQQYSKDSFLLALIDVGNLAQNSAPTEPDSSTDTSTQEPDDSADTSTPEPDDSTNSNTQTPIVGFQPTINRGGDVTNINVSDYFGFQEGLGFNGIDISSRDNRLFPETSGTFGSFGSGGTRSGSAPRSFLPPPSNLGTPPPTPGSPIVLDLDGDGVETVGLSADIHFDHDGDGFSELSGFAAADDGLLALDRNNDGIINNGSELFGSFTELNDGSLAQNGFEALKGFDSNDDGVINADDEVYSDLRVFRDLDQDGQTDSGELLTLEDAGVESLALDYTNQRFIDASGNDHRQVGNYTNAEGQTLSLTDVWFARNLTDTQTAEVEVSSDIAALPNAIGFGKTYSLHQAIARDDTGQLQGLVEQFVTASTRAERQATLEPLIFAWTNQEGDYRQYFQSPVDARKIGAVEAFYGFKVDNPRGTGQQYARLYDGIFNELSNIVFYQLAAGTYLSPFFNKISWAQNAETGDWEGDFSQVVPDLFAYTELATHGSSADTLSDFAQAIQGINIHTTTNIERLRTEIGGFIQSADADIYSPETLGLISAIITNASDTSDILLGDSENDFLFGLGGDDTVNGNAGNDVLDGGVGNDVLDGGLGNDEYRFGIGYGHDRIRNFDGTEGRYDIIRLGEGITAENITITRQGDDLVIELNGTDDVLRVESHFYGESESVRFINAIIFSDGSSLDVGPTQFDQINITSQSITEGNDELHGTSLDDTLDGLAGNDQIYGKDGNDHLNGGVGDDVLFGDAGEDVLNGGEGNDELNGGYDNDRLIGNLGHDELKGDFGDDVLIGGLGDDLLIGGDGNDTYQFALGDGLDVISNQGSTGDNDVVVLGDGILADDILITRSVNDLIIVIKSNEDEIRIQNHYSNSATSISRVVFSDSASTVSSWSISELEALADSATDKNNNLYGDNQDNTIDGLGGDDLLVGNGGNDLLLGSDGNDRLQGGDGNDHLDGGEGDDIVDGDRGDDTLLGGLGNDQLTGGSGSDTYVIIADGSHDIIQNYDNSNIDVDKIVFAEGILQAHVSYTRTETDLVIEVNQAGVLTTVTIQEGFNSFRNRIDFVEFADGTTVSIGDILAEAANWNATDQAETIRGYEGIDVITSQGGDDFLYGAEGNDVLDGGDDNDSLYGEDGDDTLFGGAGDDVVSGGVGNDRLTGDAGSDTLIGGTGDDIYTFSAGDGADVLQDTSGIDRVEFLDIASTDAIIRRVGSSLVITFVNSTDQLTLKNQFSGSSINTVATGFEILSFSDGVEWGFTDLLQQAVNGSVFDDTITAFDIADTINAGDGNDTVYTLGGDDTVDAGAGNDTVEGAAGNDRITGGLGSDTLRGGGGNDSLQGNEGDDLLYGDSGADLLEGGAGADQLYGGGGDDQLAGGDGNDTLEDYIGSNTLHGNAGDDQLEGSGQLFGDQGNDTLTGNGQLDGGAGDDILISMGSATLIGGAGNDTLHGTFSDETYVFNLGGGEDLIIETKSDQAYSNVNPSNDTLRFGEGITQSDLAFERHGNDLIVVHNNGTDKITIQNWYKEPTEHFKINNFVFNDLTVLSNSDVEALVVTYGTSGDDTLQGYRSEDDEVFGGDGDDRIFSRAGNDTLNGDGGNDYLDGGVGDDILVGGAGEDNLVGREGNDQLNGGADNDSLQGLEGDDLLVGAEGNDSLFGGANNDELQGGIGDDYLDAGIGDDILNGGAGDDQLRGGEGNDRFIAGTGNDTIIIGDSEGHDVIDVSDGGTNGIIFNGTLSIDRLSFTQDGDDLLISVDDGSVQTIRIAEHFLGAESAIDFVQPAGATLIGTNQINQLAAGEANGDYDAVVTGTAVGEQLLGTNGIDLIQGLEGTDQLYGFAGDDRLEGGEGNDRLQGGNGSNTNSGDDVLIGGAGNDILVGEDGNDRLNGGDGNDHYYYYAGTGQDVIVDDGTGQDILFFNDVSPDRLSYHQEGNDLIVLVDGDLEQQVRVENHFLGGNNEIVVQPNGGFTQTANAIASQLTDLPLADGSAGTVDPDSGATDPDTDPNTGGADSAPTTSGASANTGTTTDLSGDDTLNGTSDGEIIVAGGGADTLSGLAGDDRLLGGADNDTYIIGANSGKDVIVDTDGQNTIRFVDGITFNDVAGGLLRSGDNLTLNIAGNTNQVTIANFFSVANTIDVVEFEAGGQLTSAQLFDVFGLAAPTTVVAASDVVLGDGTDNTLDGSANSDIVITGRGDDTLHGLAGGDQLIGGAGNDTYVVGANSGQDTIIDTAGINTIQFVDGIGFNDVASGLSRTGDDLLLNIGGNTENQVRVASFFSTANTVASLTFENGSSITAGLLYGAFGVAAPTASTETYDILSDVITGGDGNDTLVSSVRNEQLSGGAGNDTYIFGSDSGVDTISNNDSDSSSVDIAQFNDVSFEDLWFSRNGNSLQITQAGTDNQVTVSNWYTGGENQLDSINTETSALLNNQVDQLVSAMAAYDVPLGVGNVVPQDVKDQLQATLAETWQTA